MADAPARDVVIRATDLHKTYNPGDNEVRALDGVSLTVRAGEMLAIMGASGSGKSTLMNILGCLDRPTSGVYELAGRRVDDLDRNALAAVRNHQIGFVFQGFNLLARSSALENVELPLLYDRSASRRDTAAVAAAALAQVGLADRARHLPSELSGGQQQRVAIARALVTGPAIILADEPTGNLDTHTSDEVMNLFKDLHRRGITIILVTHEHDVARHAPRLVVLRDGRVEHDGAGPGGEA